jgi:hypothetical protein
MPAMKEQAGSAVCVAKYVCRRSLSIGGGRQPIKKAGR